MKACLVLAVLLLSECMSQEGPLESGSDVEDELQEEEVTNLIVMEGDVEITFVCNDGFLIVSGDTKILVDALYTGNQEWSAPQEVQELLEIMLVFSSMIVQARIKQ